MIRLKSGINKYIKYINSHILSLLNSILFNIGYYDYIFSKKTGKGTDLLVLAYHSITKGNIKHAGLEVSADNFDSQINFLKKHFDIIDIDNALYLLNNNNYKNKLVITFDDGYRDNYSTALPLLIKHNVPATIFLTTDPIIQHGLLWGNELDITISESNCCKIIVDKLGLIDLSTYDKKLSATKAIKKHLKGLPTLEMKNTLNEIYKQLSLAASIRTDQRFEMLQIDEIIEMKNNNITFGSHTSTHPIVSKISNLEFENELSHSMNNIKDWTGNNVYYFAYPNGLKEDFTDESKNILKSFKYKAAFTLLRGTNNFLSDKYELKRIPIKDSTLHDFARYVLKYI